MSTITKGSMKLIKSEITDIIHNTIGSDLPSNFDKIDAGVDAVNNRVNNIITTPVGGVSAQEIIDARNGEPTLGTRLNKMQNQTDNLQDEVDSLITVGIPKLVSFDYDIAATTDNQTVFTIPYEYLTLSTDTVGIFVDGIAVPDNYYIVTEPVEVDGVITLGYVTLNEGKPIGTIVKVVILKNVPNGDEGSVDGSIITLDSIPLNRIKSHSKIMLQDEVMNPSLLINANFKNPVNQRGFTTKNYTGSNWSYCIDRWMLGIIDSAGESSGTLNNGYFTLTSKANDGTVGMFTLLENPKLYVGTTLTASFKYRITQGNSSSFYVTAYNDLTNNGLFYDYSNATKKLIADGSWHIYEFTYNVSDFTGDTTFTSLLISTGTLPSPYNAWLKPTVDCSIDIEWCKLEYGNKATLFDPRSYGEELASCQRYYQVLNIGDLMGQFYTTTSCRVYRTLGTVMRSVPTVTFPTEGTANVQAIGTGPLTGGTCNIVYGNTPSTIQFDITGLAPGNLYQQVMPLFAVQLDSEIY